MTYPTTLDTTTTIPVESANTKLSTNHVDNHTAMQTAIIAIETKLGIDGSAVTSTHDYKLSSITGSTKAVSDTNGTLTAPTLTLGSDATGDIFYRGSDGKVKRLGVGSNGQVLKLATGLPSWAEETVTNNGSTTVAGIYEEATQAEVEARTATGATGARAVLTTSNITTVRTHDYAVDAAGTDNYAITITPVPTAYTTGDRFIFKAGTANTGACTLNVNSLGAKTIKIQGRDLYTGEIVANQVVEVVYDGTDMRMLSIPDTYGMSPATFETISSSNTRTTNATARSYTTSQSSYTKMKEILYNDVGGTITVTYTSGDFSGGGVFTNYSRVYVNGVAVGTEHTDSTGGTYSDTITVATGDLVQVYTKVVLTSGSATWNLKDMYLKYDKQYKQTFITNTSNS